MKTRATLVLSLFALATSARASGSEIPTDSAQGTSDATRSSAPESRPEAGAAVASQSAVHGQELMLNAFRAPSIGLEYRVGVLSVHAGAYTTVINEGETLAETAAWFAKVGASLWFLPIGMLGHERSSFYAGASYLNDFERNGWGHAVQVEAGFRLVIYRGLFARLGASALYAPGRSCQTEECDTLKVRPNPGIGWAFAID